MEKKIYALLLISVFLLSCNKLENNISEQETPMSNMAHQQAVYDNYAVPLDMNGKSASGSYIFKMFVGHSGTNCPGCVTIGGVSYHIDCMGLGRECTASASVSMSSKGGGYFMAVTLEEYDLTTGDFFQMPARSLYVDDGGLQARWINIPEQLAFRDSLTGQFMFDGLFYSNAPAYENR